jgi:hypothetical protein
MDIIFGKDTTKNTQEIKNPEFKEIDGQAPEEDLRSSDEWNMVDDTKKTGTPSNTSSYFDMLSSASTQNVIIEILNNKLHDLTCKMDLILNKLNTLEEKIDSIEQNQKSNDILNRINNDNIVLNNFDLKNILDTDKPNSDCPVNETTQIYHNSILNYNPQGIDIISNFNKNRFNRVFDQRFPLPIPRNSPP